VKRNPSNEKTPTERHFESFYFDIQKKWTRESYHALCVRLNFTKYELGALLGLDRRDVGIYLQRNKFPKTVCRHLSNMKRFTDMKRGITPEPDPTDAYIK
jgi:hypothetical protein